MEAADGGSGGIQAMAHFHLLAHLGDQLGREVAGSGLALDEHGNLKLRVPILAARAMAVGPTTGAPALDERAREHAAEGTEAADEQAASFEISFARHFLSDSTNRVRLRPSQALFEICKNAPNRHR
jgi:hypothetical protein